jgi:two-component system, OmpR family, KDP operon response regulator KdpE
MQATIARSRPADRSVNGRGRIVGSSVSHWVAVVDDSDRPRFSEVAVHLVDSGYAVTQVSSRNQSLTSVADPTYDAIIIELGSGSSRDLSLIESIRQQSDAPLLVLSGRNGVNHKVAALDLGADHYVSRPFDIEEVLARLRALARRVATARRTAVVTLGDVEIHLAAKTATRRSGRRIRLTPTEWQLLEHLMLQPGRLVSVSALLTAVGRVPAHTDCSYVRTYIARLRQKLEHDPDNPRHLITVRGMGFRFEP